MIGILSTGAYIPQTRLPLAAASGRPAREGAPERAVAWNDEDSVTMGVSAAVHCLAGRPRDQVDGVFFASTTHPFKEKQASALIARALDLRRDVQTGDHAGSLRAGTAALRAAIDAVTAGSARCVLVIASDCRMAAPGSALEANFGDGAAAFLIGQDEPIATLDCSYAVTDEIVDLWRSDGDPFVHTWEDRFVVQEGYLPRSTEAVHGLLEKAGTRLEAYSKVALYAPDKRSHGAAARSLRLSAEQVQDPLFGQLGNAGTAFAPLLLVAALEKASAGDQVLAVSYGDGAEALSFSVTDAIGQARRTRGVEWNLSRKRTVSSYDKYLRARNLNPSEWEQGNDPGLSATIHFRERNEDISLKGQSCRKCGAIQFPCQRVCESCFALDDFDLVRLSDRQGSVVTYTLDYFFPTPDPPTIVTVTDVDGARLHIQLVNCTAEQTHIGLPVEFVFRRIHESGGRPNYYWKGSPLAEEEVA